MRQLHFSPVLMPWSVLWSVIWQEWLRQDFCLLFCQARSEWYDAWLGRVGAT